MFMITLKNVTGRTIVRGDKSEVLNEIINKSVYEISIEDLVCFRMISEVAVRNESTRLDRYNVNNLWKINDLTKEKRLENYRALLNSITHIDNDEGSWPTLCVNDLKSIPKYVIKQIVDILK